MKKNVFKFTFEDGSEALAHYGVKGMKWGEHLFGSYDIAGELNKARTEISATAHKGLDHAKAILDGTSGSGANGGGGGTSETENSSEKDTDTSNSGSEAVDDRQPLTDEQVEALAYDVIRGDWGNGEERYEALQDAGYSYAKVQTKVNDIIYGTNDYEMGDNTSGREDRV